MSKTSDDERESIDGPTSTSELISGSLAQGIGGKRGLFDSTFPTAAFLITYIASGSSLMISLWAAVGTGVIVVIVRLVRRESLRQVLTGFVGVAISAALAARTGQAQDFFVLGLLMNAAYCAAFVISILIRRPLAGYAAGAVAGDVTGWLKNPEVRRAADMASWIWAAAFALRLLVQLPLFFAGAVGPLGIAKIVMGVPLFLLAGLMSYRIMRPAMSKMSPMMALESDETPESEETSVNESEGARDENSGEQPTQ